MRIEFLLPFVLFLVVGTTAQESPCPNLFRYVYDGSQWHGVIRIPSSLGPSINLLLEMSLGSKLPSSYVGKIEPVGSNDDILQTILNGGVITYNVFFPLLDPIPKVTSIRINNQEYCPGAPEQFSDTIIDISSISLKHNLATQKDTIFPAKNDENVYYNNQPAYYPEYTTNRQIVENSIPEYIQYDQRPIQQPIQRPIQRPIQQPVQRPIQQPVQRPVERTTQRQYVEYTTRPQYIANTYSQECGKTFTVRTNSLITGGIETKPGDWPWLTAIYESSQAGSLVFICSGSLVSSSHIVTAAHCVAENKRKKKRTDFTIKLGVFNILDWTEKNQVLTRPQKIDIHPAYNINSRQENDIAVIKIEVVQFTEYIYPVCLWSSDTSVEGETGDVVGWGKDENQVKVSPKPKRAKATVVSTDTCRRKYPYLAPYTTDTTVCAGNEDGTGPCNGDSGGGLYLKRRGIWFILAVVSNNIPNPENDKTCVNDDFVIYSDIYKLIDWIKRAVQ